MAEAQLSRSELHRAAELRWRNVPPGIPSALADVFMMKLKAGSTVRMLTSGGKYGPPLVSYARFKKHCELYPSWAKEALRISDVNGRLGKGAYLRNKTHCVNGHSLAEHGRVAMHKGWMTRQCRACEVMRYKRGDVIKPHVLEKVKERLAANASLNSFTTSGRKGYLVRFSTLARYRRENPEFDRFIAENARNPLSRSHLMRFRIVPENAGFFNLREAKPDIPLFEMRAGDYEWILSLIDRRFPYDMRLDLAQDVIEALLRHAISREQVPRRVLDFVSQHRRTLGNPLKEQSLDECLAQDGTMTWVDVVSFEHWKAGS